MKKNVLILSLFVFFAVGMVAQAPAKDKKECTKTEQKAECKDKKDACCKEKEACSDKKDACCKEKKACSDKKACDGGTIQNFV